MNAPFQMCAPGIVFQEGWQQKAIFISTQTRFPTECQCYRKGILTVRQHGGKTQQIEGELEKLENAEKYK